MNPKILADLRKILANLYADESSIRGIVDQAELNSQRIVFTSTALNTWYSVLAEAEKVHRTETLLDIVADEYGNNQEFRAVRVAYRQATGRSGSRKVDPQSSSHQQKRPMPYWRWSLSIVLFGLLLIGVATSWRYGIFSGPSGRSGDIPTITATATDVKLADAALTPTATPTPTATSTPSIHPVSPQLKPTATPTATPTAIPTPKPFYFTIPITAVANNSTNEGYIEPPSGNITLGGIPFFLPDGQNSVTTQVEALQSNPTVIRLPNLNIKSPSSVHLLITGGYTKVAFRDKKVGEIRLIFSDNQSHSIDLIPGINLREWKNYGDHNVTTISDPNVTQAWAGNNKFDSSMAIIDMLTINIPANQQNNVLAAIEIYDTSAQTVGDLDPALNLIGVTVLGIQ